MESSKTRKSLNQSPEMKITKKKNGRSSKNPVSLSSPQNPPPSNRRSDRRNPNNSSPPPPPEFSNDEREKKKVKLVVRLPQSDRRHSREIDSGSGSGSGSESDPESEGCSKKRKVNGVDHGSGDGVSDQDKGDVKGTDISLHGSPLEPSPTTPLPDKKLLIFILDRLQKKDTYGVYSEPVDPDELPDYFEVIDQPMDFGTVRNKLDNGSYKNLEELEADVQLICSNAMQYNSTHTVYYRQARTIQDLAKRDFDNLKHEGDNGELQPKVVRRGRPPSNKNQKKSLATPSPADRVANDISSGATLAKEEDKPTESKSNSYNLRKGPTSSRVRPTDPFVSSYGLRNGENHSEWSVDWNNEFPASILRADMKHGRKQFTVDENRRDTYRQSVLSNNVVNMKRLVPIGVQEALAYPRSLARYASKLGPIAWKAASRKIESVLPSGVEYGPGWVGEKDSISLSQSQTSFSTENQKPAKPSTAEAVRKVEITNDSSAKPNSVSHVVLEKAGKLIESNRDRDEQGKNVSKEMWDIGKSSSGSILGSDKNASSSLQIGSPQQPDLALQL